MSNTVIEANEKVVVLPMNLKLVVFSTASAGNIDVDIQSSLSTTSLHGIAASINQHPTRNNEGQSRERISLDQSVSKLNRLPDWYTELLPYHSPNDTPVPVCTLSRPPHSYWRALFCWKMTLGCRMHLPHLGLCFTYVLNQVHRIKILQLCCQYFAMTPSLPPPSSICWTFS